MNSQKRKDRARKKAAANRKEQRVKGNKGRRSNKAHRCGVQFHPQVLV